MSDNQIKMLPLLITRGQVVFPGNYCNIDVGRPFSIAAMEKSKENFSNQIVIVSQKDIFVKEPTKDDLYSVGTLCSIDSVRDISGNYRLKLKALSRVKIDVVTVEEDNNASCFMCQYEYYPLNKEDITADGTACLKIIVDRVSSQDSSLHLPRPTVFLIQRGLPAEELTNVLFHYLDESYESKQLFLEESSINKRLALLYDLINKGKVNDKIEQEINSKLSERGNKNQKEYILREKMKIIQEQLDELDEDSEDNIDVYLKKLEQNPYPEYIKKKVKVEINRYRQLPSSSLESSMAKSYIDTVMSLPWFEESVDNNDINHAEMILNEDHYGLEKVKERILEYLAVKSVTQSLKAPILCLYGPPGTGKTSLAKSVARALNRQFVKASLGGTSDEAEIRGHRRTYVASMPGKIIKGMKTAGFVNPVFLLDEIDKMTANNHGDPASALLEVLDPEQNSFFQDNYIEEAYDLSKVLFIATANYLENIPPALKDRLELIELNTYTNEEKYHIAMEHLIPKQCKANGVDPENIVFEEDAVYYVMDCYTKEAGVRDLERKFGSIIRKSLVANLKNNKELKDVITVDKVREYLGTEIFDVSSCRKENQVGVVTGLAYTQVGGDILQIEVNSFDGKGNLMLTGNLGDVMKESATIAYSFVKSNADKYNIDPKLFLNKDLHIHFPEGAVPKDGPSAGIALTVAIVSCLTNKKINASVGMTGEVTLRGNALAIGGLKEKSLAAFRSGLKKILIPKENERNIQDLPKVVRENLQIVLINNVEDALKEVLVD